MLKDFFFLDSIYLWEDKICYIYFLILIFYMEYIQMSCSFSESIFFGGVTFSLVETYYETSVAAHPIHPCWHGNNTSSPWFHWSLQRHLSTKNSRHISLEYFWGYFGVRVPYHSTFKSPGSHTHDLDIAISAHHTSPTYPPSPTLSSYIHFHIFLMLISQ